MKRRLGNLERQLLAYAQLRKVRALRTGDLTKPLGITAKQERELYGRLSRAGLLARVRRGLYLVPRELPLGGAWTPSDALAVNTLMADRGGRYQICGPNAFNRYGFSDQVPNRVYAYNNTPAALVASTLRYGDRGTIRRIGALLETRGVSARLVRMLADALPQTSGTIPWIPTEPKRGTFNRRWGLIMNGEVCRDGLR